MPLNLTLEERIARRSVHLSNGCIISTYAKSKGGYAHVGYQGRFLYVHRVTYEMAKGPIPKGLTIDHLCRNKACCNPAHLEAVTMRENVLRNGGPIARNHRKTHCKRGHPFDAENTWISRRGERKCRECGRASQRRFKERRRATVQR